MAGHRLRIAHLFELRKPFRLPLIILNKINMAIINFDLFYTSLLVPCCYVNNRIYKYII